MAIGIISKVSVPMQRKYIVCMLWKCYTSVVCILGILRACEAACQLYAHACRSAKGGGSQGNSCSSVLVTTLHACEHKRSCRHRITSSVMVAVIHDHGQINMIECMQDSNHLICCTHGCMKTASACMINMQQVKRSRPIERGARACGRIILCNHEDSALPRTLETMTIKHKTQ